MKSINTMLYPNIVGIRISDCSIDFNDTTRFEESCYLLNTISPLFWKRREKDKFEFDKKYIKAVLSKLSSRLNLSTDFYVGDESWFRSLLSKYDFDKKMLGFNKNYFIWSGEAPVQSFNFELFDENESVFDIYRVITRKNPFRYPKVTIVGFNEVSSFKAVWCFGETMKVYYTSNDANKEPLILENPKQWNDIKSIKSEGTSKLQEFANKFSSILTNIRDYRVNQSQSGEPFDYRLSDFQLDLINEYLQSDELFLVGSNMFRDDTFNLLAKIFYWTNDTPREFKYGFKYDDVTNRISVVKLY